MGRIFISGDALGARKRTGDGGEACGGRVDGGEGGVSPGLWRSLPAGPYRCRVADADVADSTGTMPFGSARGCGQKCLATPNLSSQARVPFFLPAVLPDGSVQMVGFGHGALSSLRVVQTNHTAKRTTVYTGDHNNKLRPCT
jgi:hypothetical protein